MSQKHAYHTVATSLELLDGVDGEDMSLRMWSELVAIRVKLRRLRDELSQSLSSEDEEVRLGS